MHGQARQPIVAEIVARCLADEPARTVIGRDIQRLDGRLAIYRTGARQRAQAIDLATREVRVDPRGVGGGMIVRTVAAIVAVEMTGRGVRILAAPLEAAPGRRVVDSLDLPARPAILG